MIFNNRKEFYFEAIHSSNYKDELMYLKTRNITRDYNLENHSTSYNININNIINKNINRNRRRNFILFLQTL